MPHPRSILLSFLFFILASPAISASYPILVDCDVRVEDKTPKSDRVRVRLISAQLGKFIYQPAEERERTPLDSEWIEMRRTTSSDTGWARYTVATKDVRLDFALPEEQTRLVSSSGFEAKLLTEVPEIGLVSEQKMNCKSSR